MLHIKLQRVRVVASCCMQNFGNCSHFSERERLTVNKLSFPNNWNSYGSRSSWRIVVIGSECLTKNTAVSQKCQQNVSKIAQRHEYRLPSATIIYRYSRNFIMSIAPFILACVPQKFANAFANGKLVCFECQFDQLSKCVSSSGVSKKTNQKARTR